MLFVLEIFFLENSGRGIVAARGWLSGTCVCHWQIKLVCLSLGSNYFNLVKLHTSVHKTPTMLERKPPERSGGVNLRALAQIERARAFLRTLRVRLFDEIDRSWLFIHREEFNFSFNCLFHRASGGKTRAGCNRKFPIKQPIFNGPERRATMWRRRFVFIFDNRCLTSPIPRWLSTLPVIYCLLYYLQVSTLRRVADRKGCVYSSL